MRKLAGRVGLLTIVAALAGCMTMAGDDGASGTGTYYLHWNCGAQSQCIADWSANTGIQVTYTDVAVSVCIQQMVVFANNGTIQEWNGHVGDWCDNVSDPTELGPAPGF